MSYCAFLLWTLSDIWSTSSTTTTYCLHCHSRFPFSSHFGLFCLLPSSRRALLNNCLLSRLEVTLHSCQAGNWFFICLLYSSTITPWNDIACFISSLIRPTVFLYCHIIYLAPPQCRQPQPTSKPEKTNLPDRTLL